MKKFNLLKKKMSLFIFFVLLFFTSQAVTQADAGKDSTICKSTIKLYANTPAGGETGTWSVPMGSPVTFSDKNDPNAIASNLEEGDNTLTWKISDGGMGNSSDNVTITNNYRQPNAGSDDDVCGDTYTLSGNNPSPNTGSWSVFSGNGSFDDPTKHNATITNLNSGDNILVWTIHQCDGADVSDTVKITNNKIIAYAGSDTTICIDTVMLNANNATPGNGTWSAPVASGVTFDDSHNPNTIARHLPYGITTLTWETNNGGCKDSDDVDINNNSATKSNAGNNQEICSDQTTLNGNNPIHGTGKWSVAQGTATFWDETNRKTNASNLKFDANLLVWTISTANCTSHDTVKISNNLIEAYAGEDIYSCTDTTQLNANSPLPGKGKWTTKSLVSFDNDTLYNTISRNLNTTSSKLYWEIKYKGCKSKDSVIVRKKSDVPIAFAGNDQAICDNNTILNATLKNGEKGHWETLSGFSIYQNTENPTTTISNIKQGSNILRWTVQANGCSSQDEVIITNNLPDYPDAGDTQTLCNDSTTLNANKILIGTASWSIAQGNATFNNINDNKAIITNLKQGENILVWKSKNGICSLNDTVKIINNLPDSAFTGNDTAICANTFKLNADNPTIGIGEWSLINGNGIFSNIKDNKALIKELYQGKNTLRWTIKNKGCILYNDIIITNNLPDLPNAGDDIFACNDVAILNAIEPEIGIGKWQSVSSTTFDDETLYNTKVRNLSQGVDTLIWTLTNASCSLSDTTLLSVSQLAISHSKTDLSCYNSNNGAVNINIKGGFSDYKYKWFNNEGVLKYITKDIQNTPADTFYVNVTDAINCSITDTIIVNQPAQILANANIIDTKCSNDSTGSIVLDAIGGTGNFSYKWNINNPHYSVSDSTQNHLYNLIAGEYSVIITDKTNCKTEETFNVNQPMPITLSAEIEDVVCYNGYTGSINLTVDGGTPAYNGYTYLWKEQNDSILHKYPNGEFLSKEEDLTNLHSGTFTVTVTDLNKCSAIASYKVNQPFEGMKIESDVINVSCKDQHDGAIDITVNYGTEPYTYIWSNNETTEDLEDIDRGTYIITVSDLFDCKITDTITVNANSKDCIHIYNVFTPNGDGVNDTWEIDNISLYPDVEVFVFNQWGDKVFSSEGKYEPWDGTFKGKELPAATYYYTLNLHNGDAPYSGSVTIMK